MLLETVSVKKMFSIELRCLCEYLTLNDKSMAFTHVCMCVWMDVQDLCRFLQTTSVSDSSSNQMLSDCMVLWVLGVKM